MRCTAIKVGQLLCVTHTHISVCGTTLEQGTMLKVARAGLTYYVVCSTVTDPRVLVVPKYLRVASTEELDNYAVDTLALVMKKKLASKREQGYNGWVMCNQKQLSCMLREHVDKGDPVDVANFCAFLLYNAG